MNKYARIAEAAERTEDTAYSELEESIFSSAFSSVIGLMLLLWDPGTVRACVQSFVLTACHDFVYILWLWKPQ